MFYNTTKSVCLSFFCLLFPAVVFAQQTAFYDSVSGVSFTVQEAHNWTNLLNRKQGWFGADGIFAAPFDGKENKPAGSNRKQLIWFSDSMIGEVSDSSNKTSVMIHNSLAVFTGSRPLTGSIRFYWKPDSNGGAHTVFEPNTVSSATGDYYWLGDGFTNKANNTLYIFAYKMHNTDAKDDWSFRLTKTCLIALSIDKDKPPFLHNRQMETPFTILDSANENASFGAGIYVNTKESGAPQPDGFVYVYGVKDKNKNLVAARVRPASFENFSSWTFWNGDKWVTDITGVKPFATHVSNEMSVSALPNGKYALIYQLDGMSPFVAMQIGNSPVGPFGNVMKIYDGSKDRITSNYFTYNAKAHPSLSAPGELLISYNVNAFDFRKEFQQNPNLYRPHFIKLIFRPDNTKHTH